MMSLRSLDSIMSTAKSMRKRSQTTVLMGFTLILAFFITSMASASSRNVIDSVDVVGDDKDRIIRIHTGIRPTFTVFKLTNPMRVVIDVSGGDVEGIDGPLDIDDGIVEQIATRQFSSNGFYVGRIIVGFQTDVTYQVKAEDDALIIRASTADSVSNKRCQHRNALSIPKSWPALNPPRKKQQSKKKSPPENKRKAQAMQAEAKRIQASADQQEQKAKAERAQANAAIAQANQQLKAASDKESQIAAEAQALANKRQQIENQGKAVQAERTKESSKFLLKKSQSFKSGKLKLRSRQAQDNKAKAEKLAEREKLIAQREAQAAATIENKADPTAKLTGVKRNGTGLDTAVLLKVQGNPSLQIERIENPPRLVIDMMETERNTSRTVYGVKSPYVRRVRLGDHDSNVRAVLDLRDGNSTHNVQKVPEGILVSMKHVEPEDKVAAGGPAQAQALELSDVQFKRNGKIARIELGINPKKCHVWIPDLRKPGF